MEKNKRKQTETSDFMPFGEHLEVLRQMLFRIIGLIAVLSSCAFCLNAFVFKILFAPASSDFCLYQFVEKIVHFLGNDFRFEQFHIDLIATELGSLFMLHIKTSCAIGLLGASPYILYELLKFISPGLNENEKKYSIPIVSAVYVLFMIGALMSYFVIFPIAVRFLGTYSLGVKINSLITVDSYIDTFFMLTFMMGVVFQFPIVAFILAKLKLINYQMLASYRKLSFLIIMIISAIITPPDIFTLLLVTIPLYLLYEISALVVKHID